MNTLISYDNGLAWVEHGPTEIEGPSLRLNLCSVDPTSHYVVRAAELRFIGLVRDGEYELGAVAYGQTLIMVHRTNSQVPRLIHLPYVLDLINKFQFTPVDTEHTKSFSFLGLFKYEGSWHSARRLTPGTVFNSRINLNNLRISELPKGLLVKGDLSLCNTLLKELPDDLRVQGTLDIRYNPQLSLPANGLLAMEILHD